MKLAILVVARNNPEQVGGLIARIKASVSLSHEVFVVEWGTAPDGIGRHSSLWFADGEQRGECYGLNLALEAARLADDFDYLWVLRSDVLLEAGTDVPARLIRTLEQHPTMAILTPTVAAGGNGERTEGWRPVPSCERPDFMMRARAAHEVGFLVPDFRFAQGALEELCYRLYLNGWFVAETDEVRCTLDEARPFLSAAERLGAEGFALEWLRTNYGEDWDQVFCRATQGHGIAGDECRERRAAWEEGRRAHTLAVRGGSPVEPWPLGTEATYVLFAWPRYDRPLELEALLETYVRPILGRRDVCLALRHDERIDGPQVAAIGAIEQAFQSTFDSACDLEVLLVDDQLELQDWSRVGESVTCVLPLPSSKEEPRRSCLLEMEAPAVRTAADLLAAIPGLPSDLARAPRYTTSELDSVDWELVAEIKELHPWPYPVRIGNLAVSAGCGTDATPEQLERRTAERAATLVSGVREELDLRGRSVLELGCGCAYWSSRYVEAGATRVVGVDLDARARRRAELYWSRNDFLPPEDLRLLDGDLSEAATWDEISALGPHDVTLCVDLPRELRGREEFLRRACEVTREALVLEIENEEHDEVVQVLGDLGLEPEELPAADASTSAETRRCLVARRRAAVRPAQSDTTPRSTAVSSARSA